MIEPLKCLPLNNEILSLETQHPHKKLPWPHVLVTPVLLVAGGRDQWIAETWSASQDEAMNFRFTKRH